MFVSCLVSIKGNRNCEAAVKTFILTPELVQHQNVMTILSLFVSCQVEAYDADELNFHGGMRVSFGIQLMGATARIEREIPSISWPFFLLHGDADKLCDIRGSKLMYEKAQSSDKKIKVGMICSLYILCNWLHVTNSSRDYDFRLIWRVQKLQL